MDEFHDSLSRAAQAAFDAQLVNCAKLCDWQYDTLMTSLAAMTAASSELFAAQTPTDLLELAALQGQQALDRMQAFGRDAADVAMNKPLFR